MELILIISAQLERKLWKMANRQRGHGVEIVKIQTTFKNISYLEEIHNKN